MDSIALNIDCMEYMATVPDKYFDLAVVDPPYGIGEGSKKIQSRYFDKNGNEKKIKDYRNGRLQSSPMPKYTIKNWDISCPNQAYYNELFRVSKHCIIWGINYLSFNQKSNFSGRIFWDKCNGNNDFGDGELAFCTIGNKVRKFTFMWSGMLQGKSINEGHVFIGDISKKEQRIHPTQKPVALYDWIYLNYLPEGGKVIDTHLGSGSNRIAADKAGNIDFVGCELDEDYFAAQERRWREYKAQLKLF